VRLPEKSSLKETLAFAGIFIAAVSLHSVFQVGQFLTLEEIARWDTHFYFPSFFYFPYASLFSDGQLPWWSPLSQDGIPFYYLLFTHYPPFFPTTILFFIASFVKEIIGLDVTLYQLYAITELLINPALIILFAMLISRRLFKSVLAVALVTGLVAFSGTNNLQIYNAINYRIDLISLVFLYSFLLYYQRRTPGTRLFLALVIIFLALNAFSVNFLVFLMYLVPLFVLGLLIFYRRAATSMLREYAASFSHCEGTFFVLAVLSAGLVSWLLIAYNLHSLPRFNPHETFDPMMWTTMTKSSVITRRILPQLSAMFVDHGVLSTNTSDFAGISTLPLIVVGLLAGRGRMRFIFFFAFICMLVLMSIPGAYIVLTNALRSLEKNRHLGEIMYFGGINLVYFGAGFGLDAILKTPDDKDRKYRMGMALAALFVMLVAFCLFLYNSHERFAVNVLPWLFISGIVYLSAFGGKAARWPIRFLVSVIIVFTLSQMLYYNSKYIPTIHNYAVKVPRFVETGKELEFKMTGNYVTGNSILRGSQGYFFGSLYTAIPYNHPDLNNLRSERYTYVVDKLAEGRMSPTDVEQIIGDRFPRIRFPERIYFADAREQAVHILSQLPRLENVAVLTGAGPPGKSIYLPITGSPPSVRVDDFGFNELRLTVDSDRERYLYYADGYDRFWYARVNGESKNVYPANIAHKAVRVPAGRSEVIFRYNPWPIKALYLVAFSSTLLLLICFWKNRRKTIDLEKEGLNERHED
jgi:hypothetical protein